MLKSSGRHLGHRAGEPGTAALGQHHAVGAQGLGAAHDRSQVVGVGEAINGHQQGRFADLTATLDQARQVEGVGCGALQHDALMHGAAGELSQPGPGHLFDQHARRLGFAQQLQEPRGVPQFSGAPDAMDRPAALKGRLGRVAAPDQVAGWRCAQAFGLALGLALLAVVAACIATGVTAQITAHFSAHFSDHFSAQLTARFPSCLAAWVAAWFETPECVTPLVAPLKGAALAARVAVPFLAAPLAAAIPRPGPGPLG